MAILKSLDHRHIVRLYDFFEDPKTYHLVMEVCEGGELFERLVKKKTYNEREARDVVRILLDALAYCHDNRIAHRWENGRILA